MKLCSSLMLWNVDTSEHLDLITLYSTLLQVGKIHNNLTLGWNDYTLNVIRLIHNYNIIATHVVMKQ